MCKTFTKKVIKILSKNIKCFNKKWPIMILMGKIKVYYLQING